MNQKQIRLCNKNSSNFDIFNCFFLKDHSKDQNQTQAQAKVVSFLLKSSRRIIFSVVGVKKQLKMFQMYAQAKRRANAEEAQEATTGHDRFYQRERSRYKNHFKKVVFNIFLVKIYFNFNKFVKLQFTKNSY